MPNTQERCLRKYTTGVKSPKTHTNKNPQSPSNAKIPLRAHINKPDQRHQRHAHSHQTAGEEEEDKKNPRKTPTETNSSGKPLAPSVCLEVFMQTSACNDRKCLSGRPQPVHSWPGLTRCVFWFKLLEVRARSVLVWEHSSTTCTEVRYGIHGRKNLMHILGSSWRDGDISGDSLWRFFFFF